MENNEKMLEEIRKYCDPYSILAISGRKLIRIRCPFKVLVLMDLAGWKRGDIKWVEKVMVTRELKMVYIIEGSGYHFFLFQILLP